MQIRLTAEHAARIARLVETGEFASPEEVLTAALEALDHTAYLRRAWEEGIASGDGGEFDAEEIIREARARYPNL